MPSSELPPPPSSPPASSPAALDAFYELRTLRGRWDGNPDYVWLPAVCLAAVVALVGVGLRLAGSAYAAGAWTASAWIGGGGLWLAFLLAVVRRLRLGDARDELHPLDPIAVASGGRRFGFQACVITLAVLAIIAWEFVGRALWWEFWRGAR